MLPDAVIQRRFQEQRFGAFQEINTVLSEMATRGWYMHPIVEAMMQLITEHLVSSVAREALGRPLTPEEILEFDKRVLPVARTFAALLHRGAIEYVEELT